MPKQNVVQPTPALQWSTFGHLFFLEMRWQKSWRQSLYPGREGEAKPDAHPPPAQGREGSRSFPASFSGPSPGVGPRL